MQKLLAFIAEKKHWLLLLTIQAFCLTLYFGDSFYRRGLKAYASSFFTGRINEVIARLYSYADLQQHNRELLVEHARLEQELVLLRRHIADIVARQEVVGLDSLGLNEGNLSLTARIVNMRNEAGSPYYVIDKGRSHGLKADMPVMSAKGVVGAVLDVSEYYAIVVPIINPKVKLSTVVKGKSYQGYVSTQGHNLPVYFAGVSLQAEINKGDTILTSGYSYLYPEGLMVGVVEEQDQKGAIGAEAAFASYRIHLSTDFDKLKHVYVLLLPPITEAQALEDSLIRKDE